MLRSPWRSSFLLALLLVGGIACSSDSDPDKSDSIDEGDAGPTNLDTDLLDGEDETSEPDTTSSDVEPDTDDDPPDRRDGGMADTTPDAPDTTHDTGPDCEKDSDSDGLTDCEERELCTDPYDGDTDGDHLGDLEEIQNQTDPCDADSDDDGVPDNRELEFGLDPNRASSYEVPSKPDDKRWFLDHCEEADPEPINFRTNYQGNWTIALPPAFNYTQLSAGLSRPESAAVYDDSANEVSGALLARSAPASQNSPLTPLQNDIDSEVRSLAQVDYDLLGSEFTTHNRKQAAIMEYEVSVTQPISTRRFREDVLFALAPVGRSDVDNLPPSGGTQHQEFRLEISVTLRRHVSGEKSNLISIAVAPLDQFESLDKVRFRVDDLTNTTNVSDAQDVHREECWRDKPNEEKPKAEFYWVLDQSGSMDSKNNIIRSFSSQFEGRIQNTQLDYQLGVTNMDPNNDGRLYLGPGWHKSGDTFSDEIRDRVTECGGSGWNCSGGQEHGLEAANKGLRHMKELGSTQPNPAEKIRSESEVFTVFMTDEGAQGDWDEEFLTNNTTAFALTVQNETSDCTMGPTEVVGNYSDIALGSGGSAADICSGDLRQILQDIIRIATGKASDFEISETPISSSLRVYLDNQWVPRSTENGFDYFPSSNTVAFFGDYRPDFNKPRNEQPDWIGVSFETFNTRCKEVLRDDDVDTCAPPEPDAD